MGRSSRFSPEVRERTVRTVVEHTPQHGSEWAAICSIAGKLGCGPETLQEWVRRAEVDAGKRPGLTTTERERSHLANRRIVVLSVLSEKRIECLEPALRKHPLHERLVLHSDDRKERFVIDGPPASCLADLGGRCHWFPEIAFLPGGSGLPIGRGISVDPAPPNEVCDTRADRRAVARDLSRLLRRGPGACAHWVCIGERCVTEICPPELPTHRGAWHIGIMDRESAGRALLAQLPWLRRLARLLVRDAASAEDLVQEACLAALERPPLPDRELRPWLAVVLRNLVRMGARKRHRRLRREACFGTRVEVPVPADVALLGRALEQCVQELLESLEEPHRGLLLQRYRDGLSTAAIARRQGVTPATVRWRLMRARAELRRRLDERYGPAAWVGGWLVAAWSWFGFGRGARAAGLALATAWMVLFRPVGPALPGLAHASADPPVGRAVERREARLLAARLERRPASPLRVVAGMEHVIEPSTMRPVARVRMPRPHFTGELSIWVPGAHFAMQVGEGGVADARVQLGRYGNVLRGSVQGMPLELEWTAGRVSGFLGGAPVQLRIAPRGDGVVIRGLYAGEISNLRITSQAIEGHLGALGFSLQAAGGAYRGFSSAGELPVFTTAELPGLAAASPGEWTAWVTLLLGNRPHGVTPAAEVLALGGGLRPVDWPRHLAPPPADPPPPKVASRPRPPIVPAPERHLQSPAPVLLGAVRPPDVRVRLLGQSERAPAMPPVRPPSVDAAWAAHPLITR
jgi:transposase